MQKIELPLSDVQKLNMEITDLLTARLPVYIKFKLHTLKKKMHDSVETGQNIEKELFEKYGYKDNGTYKIKIDTENYTKFNEEKEELMKEKIELEYEPFKLSVIENVETTASLDIFFKLVNHES